ncbi:hypothetical protein CFP56_020939 [Quercus suber]|uniref:Uncharacterized protein n=1 Tax=Quercus suber TaxID=58331 RepID=A0AAW0LZB0_QUESU
MIGWSSEAY